MFMSIDTLHGVKKKTTPDTRELIDVSACLLGPKICPEPENFLPAQESMRWTLTQYDVTPAGLSPAEQQQLAARVDEMHETRAARDKDWPLGLRYALENSHVHTHELKLGRLHF